MKLLNRILNRPLSGNSGDSGSATGGSATEDHHSLIPGYDRLDDKEVATRLRGLSQVELAAVEAHERSDRARPGVLDKLRYMRTPEPLPAYDTLTADQIIEALSGANTGTVKAVRDYERKFGGRPAVLEETARVLPTSTPSPRESRARAENVARVSEGVAGRATIADRLASRRSTPPATGD